MVRVGILGASGYTGAELIRLLRGHGRATLAAVCAGRRAGERLDAVFPHLTGELDATLEAVDVEALARRCDVAFCALPHGESAAAVDALRGRGLRVVDLSADFRLGDPEAYRVWYKLAEHPAPARLGEAVYGLVELRRDQLRDAQLIAVPGCYPTAATLALAPLVRARLIDTAALVVDAKSGVSGAGRSPAAHTHFPEAAEGLRAYGVAGHRHTPEIEQELSRLAGAPLRVTFTPHLVPMNRGILATGYARARPGVTAADLARALDEAWAGEPFVRPVRGLPDTAHVRGSNRAHVAVRFDERTGTAVALCAIDNLVKGAAGQAIQGFNVALGFPEDEGLRGAPVFP